VDAHLAEFDTQLPYAWDKVNPGQQGHAIFDLTFDVGDPPTEPWGLFVQRAGNAFEIWLNGALLQREGELQVFNGGDYGQVPRYVTVSPELIQNHNVLQVRIRADIGRKGGLTPLIIGPQVDVLPLYERSYMVRGTASLLIAVFSLLVGSLALLLWVSHPAIAQDGSVRRDRVYLFAGLAELPWSFSVGYMFFEVPPIPWPWWGAMPIWAACFWLGFTILFCMEAAGWSSLPGFRWFRRWLFVLIATNPLFSLTALALGKPMVLTVTYALVGTTNCGFAIFFLSRAMKQPAWTHKLIGLALIANAMLGLRDLYVARLDPSYSSITWLRYSSMLFGVSVMYVVLARFRQASRHAHDLTQTLASRVAAKELELHDSFKRLEILARDQERSAERTRILRDMHDGVGAHISTAIRQVQSGQAKDSEVLQTLHESLDQLKLSIDAMTLPPGDVTALLANLRYRLEPRFKALDIELQWEVDLLDPLPHLDDKGMRSLQFLVYGAIANVLQHAGASVLRIEAKRTALGLRVCIVDNGCGFDTTLPKRRGLLSMEERARAIGATLRLYSAPGATTVEIGLA
jgi:signal transduction histidine kinase